jgi:hypothetical protein
MVVVVVVLCDFAAWSMIRCGVATKSSIVVQDGTRVFACRMNDTKCKCGVWCGVAWRGS